MRILQGIVVTVCECGKHMNVFALRAVQTPAGMFIQQQLFGVIYFN